MLIYILISYTVIFYSYLIICVSEMVNFGEAIRTQVVVQLKPVPGKVPKLPGIVLNDLSRDQLLAYKWGHAIQSGIVPDNLPGQTIGPLVHVRWLTRAIRTLARWSRTMVSAQKL